MFGVASMLCRLGLRPRATSALAPRVVADFMATLAYVYCARDGYLCSYASDPLLALGAMKVWHSLDHGLADHILPQLKKLILDEVLDTGGVGEMVGCIVMLLAMDKCAMGDEIFSACLIIGQFIRVNDFLDVLQAGEMAIYDEGQEDPAEDNRPAFDDWLAKWKGWSMGFTHFIQLELEPDEDTLWYLLGRRVAGIFPRDKDGANLLIPMFKKSSKEGVADGKKIAVMLVQVNNRSRKAEEKLTPWFVFGGKDEEGSDVNPLSKMDVHDIIRISMSIHGEKENCYKFIDASSNAGNLVAEPDGNAMVSEDKGPVFTICFGSVCCESWMQKLLRDWRVLWRPWNPVALVDGDLGRRGEDEADLNQAYCKSLLAKAMPTDDLMEDALKGLAQTPGRQQNDCDSDAEKRVVNEIRMITDKVPDPNALNNRLSGVFS
ncbi:hypothetical protein PC129_g16866 [Phytophthora cactorum]|uniref:Uncharacterized protein n=2 Tax=Phytophthora cactorum TaxID=29920 RepID=A0A8T1K515_9STRA|nr:hypothetical protein Pcac1_g4386 [Phytophthora cactorum]KAG2805234.1 hypothetical protein PC112_g18356 [Phytophthora cactorum]KAG2813250.1 hypothetical protein PC111_g14471 [Phytophthora cactorum]KAG2845286.1 hypothetical protein PC113_g18222 [Phytophthora cactorum]KAG2885060.1 hypothetical protein PC114_g19857 [Phytophthora cactorum]